MGDRDCRLSLGKFLRGCCCKVYPLLLLILAPCSILTVSVAAADVLTTKSGATWEGKVTLEGDTYLLVKPNGSKMQFPKDMVKEVVIRKDSPVPAVGTKPSEAAAKASSDSPVPTVGTKPSEAVAEASEVPLPSILAEANQRIKALMDDHALTSAQRSAAMEKEVAPLRQVVEGRVWIMPCEVVDVSKAGDSLRLHDIGKADDSGDWNITLRIHGLDRALVTVCVKMGESQALAMKKGQPLRAQCQMGLERSSGREPLGLALKSASIYEGPLPAAGVAAGNEVTFLGIRAKKAKKTVYIIDRSGSMTDSIDFVKYELKRSIRGLDDSQEFHIIFYSSGPPVEMPTQRLVSATDRNKQLAFEFINGILPQGETDPSKALERAFSCQPDVIYLLTDGEFNKTLVGFVKRLNVGGKVTVHTIGFLYQTGEQVLKQIANDNNGTYKFVSEKDLATLAQ